MQLDTSTAAVEDAFGIIVLSEKANLKEHNM